MTNRYGFKQDDKMDEPVQFVPSPCGSYNVMPAMRPMAQPGGYQVQQPIPPLPTGYPTGPTTTPLLPGPGGLPALPGSEQPPTTLQSTLFTPGFLRTQIGKKLRIEFLIGTGTLVDRSGTLLSVGASYIVIRLADTDDLMMCDMYSIKFVTIFH